MPAKKKSAKTKRASKQAMADLKTALKTQEKLEMQLAKVKKHLTGLMSAYWNWGP